MTACADAYPLAFDARNRGPVGTAIAGRRLLSPRRQAGCGVIVAGQYVIVSQPDGRPATGTGKSGTARLW
ncbi:hypothetical protein MSAR_18950 [Mycolicibacterium sarraceniae]|uniref:Uncharacterized protein n=1 Tax=Mycolicibacterium sarraceniae TaxID=1534348 RepID=A0A7I7SRH8_9MYCO|nr:hypothetical protein MSAR_18950 [Mycolicibacterium sarraceniae]